MTETLWKDPEVRDKTYLEIACGEAPFITSRYDAATGNTIPLEERVGILDRKLQVAEKAAEGGFLLTIPRFITLGGMAQK